MAETRDHQIAARYGLRLVKREWLCCPGTQESVGDEIAKRITNVNAAIQAQRTTAR